MPGKRLASIMHDVARLCLALLLLAGSVHAAVVQVSDASETSLRCAGSDPTERATCADATLKRLHARMTALFERAVQSAHDTEEVRAQQRRWIGARNLCRDTQCIKTAYLERIDELERSTGALPDDLIARLCARIADPAARARVVQAGRGATDINNDGLPDLDDPCSASAPVGRCSEPRSNERMPLSGAASDADSDERNFLAVEAISYSGKTFLLSALDDALAQPAFLSYVTPDNNEHVLCEFVNEIQSPVKMARSGSRAVCDAVASASAAVEPIAFGPGTLAYPAFSRIETTSTGIAQADVDNDGGDERVAALIYASEAARGCTYEYFDLVDADGVSPLEESKRRLFLSMQGIDSADGFHGVSCGVVRNRLFRFDGRLYFEHNVKNAEGDARAVWSLTGAQIRQVCVFGRKVRTQVRMK